MNDPVLRFEMFVRASRSDVWAILSDDSKTPLYQHFSLNSRSDFKEGGIVEFLMGDRVVILGKFTTIIPEEFLSMSFRALWSAEVENDGPSRVSWVLESIAPEVTKVTLIHDGFGQETNTSRQVGAGWIEAFSRLKTLLETGVPLEIPHQYEAA